MDVLMKECSVNTSTGECIYVFCLDNNKDGCLFVITSKEDLPFDYKLPIGFELFMEFFQNHNYQTLSKF